VIKKGEWETGEQDYKHDEQNRQFDKIKTNSCQLWKRPEPTFRARPDAAQPLEPEGWFGWFVGPEREAAIELVPGIFSWNSVLWQPSQPDANAASMRCVATREPAI